MKTPLDNDLNKVYESFNQNHNHLRQTLMASLPDSIKQHKQTPWGAHTRDFIRGTIMKSRITKLATAAVVIIAVLVGMHWFGSSFDGVSVAFANVREAMDQMPLVHKVLHTYRDGKKYHTENWYSFESRTVLSKFSVEGECFKISSLNYDTMKNVVYDPNSDVVKILYRTDVSSGFLPASPRSLVEDYIEVFEQQNASVEHEKDQYEGKDVDIYYFSIPRNFRGDRVEVEFIVDHNSHLPIVYKRKFWTPENHLRFDQVVSFDFPEKGPENIYDLGVPRSTKVFYDSASKKLLHKKRKLLEDKRTYEKQFERSKIYRLDEGQILKHIHPSLVGPRAKIDQINDLIRQLKSGLTQKDPTATQKSDYTDRYTMFLWDGKIIRENRPLFPGGISLKTAFERIIGLSKFQYDISDELSDMRIPGDWIARKGTTKEQLLRAFEKIIQEYTGRAIRFEQHQIERNVIVARGEFQFKPLSGAYDDYVIHVFSDKLDPDERGGGGSGTLDKFLRSLGDIPLNEQVINESTGSEDIRVYYGWHYSGYLRKLTDETEKMEKLEMLLGNLSRQTGLTFSRQRRIVEKWFISEGQVGKENPSK